MGQWTDERAFDIANVKRTIIGAAFLYDFEVRATAPILRAWADGSIFFEKHSLIKSCFGCLADGNTLRVKRFVSNSPTLPQITIEVGTIPGNDR